MQKPVPWPPTPDPCFSDRLAYAIATGAGAGFAPVAPGTFGAIEAVLIFILMTALIEGPGERMALFAVFNLLVMAAGIWASGRTCRACGVEDPGQIVIDEISGQSIALAPLVLAPSAAGVLVAFLSFRLFDIFKPYPIRKLEYLPGGLGVMMDDALAGGYAAALVWLFIELRVL
ncbi:MAG TPA: phosphatidylglycerophosphatase A [Blastocatellia bacterium]|nr:phosphatidylglycerophosphatase A [Blastocatellia bacterium]